MVERSPSAPDSLSFGSSLRKQRGAAGAWWPNSSSKRAGRGPPPPGRFDPYVAPYGTSGALTAALLPASTDRTSYDGVFPEAGSSSLTFWCASTTTATRAMEEFAAHRRRAVETFRATIGFRALQRPLSGQSLAAGGRASDVESIGR